MMSLMIEATDGVNCWFLNDEAVTMGAPPPDELGYYWWIPPEGHRDYNSGFGWIVLAFEDPDDGLMYQQIHGRLPELVSQAGGEWSERLKGPEEAAGDPATFWWPERQR